MESIKKDSSINTNIDYSSTHVAGNIVSVNKTEAAEIEASSKESVNAEEFIIDNSNTPGYINLINHFAFQNQSIFEWFSDIVGSVLSKLNISDKETEAIQILSQNGINVDRSQIIGIKDHTIYLTNGVTVMTRQDGTVSFIKAELDDTFGGSLSVGYDKNGNIIASWIDYDDQTLSIRNLDDLLYLLDHFHIDMSNITSVDEDSISFNRNGLDYEVYISGDLLSIVERVGQFQGLIGMISNGHFINGSETTSIFDEMSEYSGQYGGNQHSFISNIDKLLTDDRIIRSLMNSFPELNNYSEAERMEIMEAYLTEICKHGCGYVAMVNTIFEQYIGREKEFESIFGFPMYTVGDSGIPDFNYEYLILEYVNYIWSHSVYDIVELSGYDGTVNRDAEDLALNPDQGEDTAKITGTGQSIKDQFEAFMKETYNMDVDVSFISTKTGMEASQFILNNFDENSNTQYIIAVKGSELYDVNGDLTNENVGAHAMCVTGINADGQIEVSSWGKKFTIDLNDIEWVYVTEIAY